MLKEFNLKNIKLKYILQKVKSLPKARNTGMNTSENDIIFFLDDDVELCRDYAENIINFLEKNKDFAGVSGNDLNANEPQNIKWTLRKYFMRIFLINRFDGRITKSGFGYPIYERQIKEIINVETLPGCNICISKKRARYERFDEWFTGYAFREDVDFTYRVSTHSKLAMLPSAKFYHQYSNESRLNIYSLKIMEVKNYYYFYAKNIKSGVFSDILFHYSLFGLLLLYFIEFIFNINSKDKKSQFMGFLKGTMLLIFNKKEFMK